MQKGSLVSLRSLPIEGGRSILLSDCDEESQEAWKDPAVVVKGPYEHSSQHELVDGKKMIRVYRAVDIMHNGTLYVAISIEHLTRIG